MVHHAARCLHTRITRDLRISQLGLMAIDGGAQFFRTHFFAF